MHLNILLSSSTVIFPKVAPFSIGILHILKASLKVLLRLLTISTLNLNSDGTLP